MTTSITDLMRRINVQMGRPADHGVGDTADALDYSRRDQAGAFLLRDTSIGKSWGGANEDKGNHKAHSADQAGASSSQEKISEIHRTSTEGAPRRRNKFSVVHRGASRRRNKFSLLHRLSTFGVSSKGKGASVLLYNNINNNMSNIEEHLDGIHLDRCMPLANASRGEEPSTHVMSSDQNITSIQMPFVRSSDGMALSPANAHDDEEEDQCRCTDSDQFLHSWNLSIWVGEASRGVAAVQGSLIIKPDAASMFRASGQIRRTAGFKDDAGRWLVMSKRQRGEIGHAWRKQLADWARYEDPRYDARLVGTLLTSTKFKGKKVDFYEAMGLDISLPSQTEWGQQAGIAELWWHNYRYSVRLEIPNSQIVNSGRVLWLKGQWNQQVNTPKFIK